MLYDKFKYIYPPRATTKVTPAKLDTYRLEGRYYAQPKMNGACAVLFIPPVGTIGLYNRHGETLTNFDQALNFSPLFKCDEFCEDGWMVVVGEYMNKNKANHTGDKWNHKFVVFDILVHNGVYLIGTKFQERLDLLQAIYGNTKCDDEFLYQIDENLYRVATYINDFSDVFKRLIDVDMYEGLVFKRANAKLEAGWRENNNGAWQFKVRKPTKNYAF